MSAAREWSPPQYTADDLFEMPEDGFLYELIRGELHPMPLPGARHGRVGLSLAGRVNVFVEDHDLGAGFLAETGFLLGRNPDTVLGADLAFVAKHRLPEETPVRYLDLAPDLVLEVRSPSASAREVREKLQLWLEAGVKVAWDLDPDAQTLTVHRSGREPQVLTAADVLTEEELLPGFSFSLGRLFPTPGEAK